MKIRQVTAHAFGPLSNQSLDLAECMTVIVGPNESGKSSWHAAIYAALCGMRRGPGQRSDDTEFAQRHRPWDCEEWGVSCLVDLDDGRSVELRHELVERVDCTARDLILGRDVTDEIVHDGSADGSRWLGLERRAFRAVASIRQAQILTVTSQAETLQQYLQRAAATAGTDETAAAALGAIDSYSRDHVGLRRANSRKPLMAAIRRVEEAEREHTQATADHQEWLSFEQELAKQQERASDARALARASEAKLAGNLAGELQKRAVEAHRLAQRHPAPPRDLEEDAALAEQVATALHDWEHRPKPEPLTGPTASELKARLATLPSDPDGDLEPADDARIAHRTLIESRDRHEAHIHQRPDEPVDIDAHRLTETELLEIARELETPVPEVDPELRERVERLRSQEATTSTAPRRVAGIVMAVAAAAALLTGVSLLAGGSTTGGILGIGAAGVFGAITILLLRRRDDSDQDAELRAAETRLVIAEQLEEGAQRRRQEAARRAEASGLEPDSQNLREIAERLRRAEHAIAARAQWEDRNQALLRDLEDACRNLSDALRDRGVDVGEHNTDADRLTEAFGRYEYECRKRREQATAAAERPGLEQALEARARSESELRQDEDEIERARSELHTAAAAAGITDDPAIDEEELVRQLKSWRQMRAEERTVADTARNEWSRLQALLDGMSLEQLVKQAHEAKVRAEELSAACEAQLLEEMSLGDHPQRVVQDLVGRASSLEREVATARGQQQARAQQVISVPEAEENLAQAREALAKIEDLAEVLDATKQFLTSAQERVHRDIAPVLSAKIRGRLASVTADRYSDVSVDPETLQVQARDADNHWRNAELLSHGTAEQVYLLLRVAMAEILTTNGTSCPLLIDDATVQSDPGRTTAILEVLHDVSSEHQVILFSQEDHVRVWAEEHLDRDGRDALVELNSSSAPSPRLRST